MKPKRIYRWRTSVENNRPEIDATASAVEDWEKPYNVIVPYKNALEWDFYSLGGKLGLLSERGLEVLQPYMKKHFSFLKQHLNGIPYYEPVLESTIDCFDRENAKYKTYPHDPGKIMRILKFSFFLDRIEAPLVFCIPETRKMLVTEQIPEIVEQAGLRGFEFQLEFPR